MTFLDLVGVSDRVASTSSRREKIAILASFLTDLAPGDVEIAVAFLTGRLRQGRLGLGWAMLEEARSAGGATSPSLTLREVDDAFARIATISGRGSATEKVSILRGLFQRAEAREQRFLARLVLGELRQGALEGIMVDAIARAAGRSVRDVRRAAMAETTLAAVATAALGGEGSLGESAFGLLRPVQPMLAQSVADVEGALERLPIARAEYKLDGARIQAHKSGDEVRIFSRRLRDVTAALPEVVERLRGLSSPGLILDGEVIAIRPDGRPQPFQDTMRRFGRKVDVEDVRRALPVVPFFFDILHLEGETLIDEPHDRRAAALEAVLPAGLIVPHRRIASPAELQAFLAAAIADGHEGVMVKSLEAPYEAGRRGHAWLKLKPARTLDLVVLAAEWGSGRRQGWLSNLHLGARDPDQGGFVMLGKTFKGLTDAMLAWQTERFLQLEIGRDRHAVHLRPEIVVEIAFNDVQTSPHYPGGLALRFARVKRFRPDKRADDADTIDTVRRLHEESLRRS